MLFIESLFINQKSVFPDFFQKGEHIGNLLNTSKNILLCKIYPPEMSHLRRFGIEISEHF